MKTKQFYYLMALVLLYACSSNEEIDMENTKLPYNEQIAYITIPDTSKNVTAQTVESVAKLFSINKVNTRATEKEIDDIQTVSTENGTPLFYIVNYKNRQGFIIISATKDYTPVLAHSDTGHFNINKIDNTGVSLWITEQKAIISSINELPDSIKLKYRAMWTEYNAQQKELDLPQSRSRDDVFRLISSSVSQWEREGYTVYWLSEYKRTDEFRNLPQEVQDKLLTLPLGYANPNYGGRENVSFVLKKTTDSGSQINPLLQTKWHGGTGYNQYNGGYPIGEMAVTIGQIMKYHQYPTSFAWNQMPNEAPSEITALFLRDIVSVSGIDCLKGTDHDLSKAVKAFQHWGYTQVRIVSHSTNLVKSELHAGRPVLMKAKDSKFGKWYFVWVCDGYYSSNSRTELELRTLEDCPSDYEPKMFLTPYTYAYPSIVFSGYHMNWGANEADGYTNGYYNETPSNFTGMEFILSQDRQNIVSIYPVQ